MHSGIHASAASMSQGQKRFTICRETLDVVARLFAALQNLDLREAAVKQFGTRALYRV